MFSESNFLDYSLKMIDKSNICNKQIDGFPCKEFETEQNGRIREIHRTLENVFNKG
jgi:glutathione peroxidase-family protein